LRTIEKILFEKYHLDLVFVSTYLENSIDGFWKIIMVSYGVYMEIIEIK
jgi:hypothetical protein